jgi:cation:H+ antiporter
MVFAWKGGNAVEAYGPSCHPPGAAGEDACSLALANMTGANRLLIGIGWSLVVFIAYWRSKDRPEGRIDDVQLERSHSVEVSFLAIATLYSLTLPLKGTISLVDAAILISIFAAYTWRISRAPAEEPHLVGPARLIGTFTTHRRRFTVVLMFVFAAAVILACAEPFAEALVTTGREFGVSEFLLVQWLAPLASEAPELLVAGSTPGGSIRTRDWDAVSSKVNQWTLRRQCRSSSRSASASRRAADRHPPAWGAVLTPPSRSSRWRCSARSRSACARLAYCSACSGLSSSSGRSCPSPPVTSSSSS